MLCFQPVFSLQALPGKQQKQLKSLENVRHGIGEHPFPLPSILLKYKTLQPDGNHKPNKTIQIK